jgi:putative transposase
MLGFMARDGVISDELWALIEPVLPGNGVRRGRPWNDHRLTLEGIAWRFRVGAPWRDVPEEFGSCKSLWERHRLWSTDGTYEKIFEAVRDALPGQDPDVLELLSVDSTIVRVHQHAAGARFSGPEVLTGGSSELQGPGRRTR